MLAMSDDLRLEFAFVENIFEPSMSTCVANPESWELLSHHEIQRLDAPPGWRLDAFVVWLKGIGELAQCFVCHVTADGWMCIPKRLEGNRFKTNDFLFGRVVVREVLSCLVINCDISITENAQFEAVFTTLADTEVTRLQGEPPSLLMVRHLHDHVKETAVVTGHLRSRNQRLAVQVNDAMQELDAGTILWDKFKIFGLGLLQRG